jgi:Cfr10I/Bse634I restriction endonuclease
VPFAFDPALSTALPPELQPIEDRRNNPVRGRPTLFRLAQANMLAYTFPDFIPGFAQSGINLLPFPKLLRRPIDNALRYGQQLYGQQFEVSSNQVAKVAGDIFQEVEAAILWNAAARWNRFMAGQEWDRNPRYPAPSARPSPGRQVAVVGLPRRYDWVRLLTPGAAGAIETLRADLTQHDLLLPTSTPDIIVTVLPPECRLAPQFSTDIENLGHEDQKLLRRAHLQLEGRIEPGEIILAIALKKSLRSDRLYQPLYEANIMQLLLEGKLGAPRVDFEVHTLESAGTAARDTYRAASLAAVATGYATPHRAIRDLYEPANADELVRRFYEFLNERTAGIKTP